MELAAGDPLALLSRSEVSLPDAACALYRLCPVPCFPLFFAPLAREPKGKGIVAYRSRHDGILVSVHFVIVGCGRVGALIADELDGAGHSVAIIDQNPDAFSLLSSDFSGRRVTGSGFDRAVLKKARIEDAYAFAAVSNGDNSNIIAARTAAGVFGVKHVVARISDPDRASLYERLGIPTIAATRRIGAAVLNRLLPPGSSVAWTDPTGNVSLIAVRPAPSWYGQSFREVEQATGGNVAFVSRLSSVEVARPYMVVQEQDELYIAVEGTDAGPVRDVLMEPPGGEQA